MKTIYAYTTETYSQKNWLKVGQTILTAEERVTQQDSTSNPEPLVIAKTWLVPDNITDKKIHKMLIQNGCNPVRMDKSREWFKCTVEDVDIAINSIIHGIARPNSFPMRDEQKAATEQAAAHFASGGSQFLINAKMRFGKTFVSYQIVKQLEYTNVLVLTYKPSVEEAWREDLEKHVDFDGWNYSSGKGFDHDPSAKVNVIFASFQDLNDFHKDKWSGIADTNFDLVIIDEMHYGSETERAKMTLDHIKCDRRLYVSGTPLDAIISGKFSDSEIYTWSYVDEQAKRRAEQESGWATDVYRWLPKMEIHTFSVCDDAKRAVAAYSDDEQFTMTKMFGSDDGVTFTDEASVKLFIDQVFGRGVHKNKSPYKTHAADHSLWVMPPNVKSVNAMCAMLEKVVGDDYHIINVAGDNISSLSKVKQMISHYDKTITVTCGRFNTGVTVPEWDVIMMLNDGKAPETYFQTIFRAQSPDKSRGKELCHVFDFNPERALELVYTYAELTAKEGTATAAGIRQFLDFCPIIDHSGNNVITVDTESIVSFIAESGSLIDKFSSNYLFDKEQAMKFCDLLVIGDSIISTCKNKSITTNDLDTGKNYLNNGQKAPKTSNQKKLIDELIEKAKVVTSMVPEFVTFVHPSKHLEELLEADEQDFENHFEISLSMFKEMCYNGFINKQRLNQLIETL